MSKKYFFVLSSSKDITSEQSAIQKATAYYGTKDYSYVGEDPKFWKCLKTTFEKFDGETNLDMLLLGTAVLAMSLCDSIYVCKDWEETDICKTCHAIAFAHGLEIIYEQ